MKNTQFGKVFVPASIRGTLRNECAVENSRRTGNLQAHGLKTGHNTARLTTVALVDVDRQTSPVAPYPWREGSLEEAHGVGRRSWGWSGVCEKSMGHGLLPGSPSFTEKAEGSLRISTIRVRVLLLYATFSNTWSGGARLLPLPLSPLRSESNLSPAGAVPQHLRRRR